MDVPVKVDSQEMYVGMPMIFGVGKSAASVFQFLEEMITAWAHV